MSHRSRALSPLAAPSSVSIASFGAVLSLAATGLFGCAASSASGPGVAAPTGETAVVNVGGGEQAEAKADPKAEAEAARKKAVEEAAQLGILGALNSGELSATGSIFGDLSEDDVSAIMGGLSGGIIGSGSGGVAGGVVGGIGGLGLSGAGVGGGGTGSGIGLGSIGTLGHGSGSGSGYGIGGGSLSVGTGSGFGYGSSNSMPGTAINVGGGVVVELHDATTLGVSPEQGARALRDKVYSIRSCYVEALRRHSGAYGTVGLWLVVKSDGRIGRVVVTDSTLGDSEALPCLSKAFESYYVGMPSQSSYGLIQASISLRPAPKP